MLKRNLSEESIYIKILRARESVLAFFKPVFRRYKMTEQQWRILATLKQHDLITFNELADVTLILRPSLTGILNRLEKRGYVQRLKIEGDQRKVSLRLTADGESICDEMRGPINEQYAKVAAMFEADEFERLCKGLDVLNELAEDQRAYSSQFY